MDEAFFTELSAWLAQLAWQALRNPTSPFDFAEGEPHIKSEV
jgi:hypothetical protein